MLSDELHVTPVWIEAGCGTVNVILSEEANFKVCPADIVKLKLLLFTVMESMTALFPLTVQLYPLTLMMASVVKVTSLVALAKAKGTDRSAAKTFK